jgi:hypothetical protein
MGAVYFSCGLGLGVVLGAALWSSALYFAKLAATSAQRKQLAEWRQATVSQQKRIEKAKADLRTEYGNEMSPEQERIMQQELAKVFKEMPNPGIPRHLA